MTQVELNREVARATGETISEIGHRGFSFVDPGDVSFDPEPDDASRYVNWDAVDAERYALLPS